MIIFKDVKYLNRHQFEYLLLYFGLFVCGVITGMVLIYIDRDKHDAFHMEKVLRFWVVTKSFFS